MNVLKSRTDRLLDHPRAGADKAIQNLQYEEKLHNHENDYEQWVRSTAQRLTNMAEAPLPRLRVFAIGEEANERAEAEEMTCELERKIEHLKEEIAKGVREQQRK